MFVEWMPSLWKVEKSQYDAFESILEIRVLYLWIIVNNR